MINSAWSGEIMDTVRNDGAESRGLIAASSLLEPLSQWAVGQGVDITDRMLAEASGGGIQRSVVVVNHPGATGGVGVGRMVAAKPDGYTVAYVWNAPVTIVPQILRVVQRAELSPVSQTTSGTPHFA
jgi:tripartite-type tricarboxylate transporter receptor subunit TctC